MKVLAIVSSARKTGNSEILAKAMLAALPDSTEKKLLRLPNRWKIKRKIWLKQCLYSRWITRPVIR